MIVYANEVKSASLGVKPETLADLGAVSEQTVREMAEGARAGLRLDVAVAITGVAGPDGGAPDKPVGTVCFAVCGPGTTRTSTKLLRGRAGTGCGSAAAYCALESGAALLRHAQAMTTALRSCSSRSAACRRRRARAGGDRWRGGAGATRCVDREVGRAATNLHVTLKFLGLDAEDALGAWATRSTRRWSAPAARSRLRRARLGAFPSLRQGERALGRGRRPDGGSAEVAEAIEADGARARLRRARSAAVPRARDARPARKTRRRRPGRRSLPFVEHVFGDVSRRRGDAVRERNDSGP